MENETIQTKQKYTFNENTQKYVFHSQEKFGRNVVLGSKKVNTIIELYSNYDKFPHTMGDISKKLGIPKAVIEFIIKAMGITHDTIPFSQEKIEESDVDVLVDEMLDNKSFQINQKFEKLDWKRTQEDATKWREFTQLNVNPFKNFIENWVPPKYVPIKTVNKVKSSSQQELIVGCSDWHYGLFAHERYLYNQKEWNIDETEKSVANYAEQLKEYISQKDFKKLNVCFMGDLSHTLTGETDKGTKLEAHPIGEEQLERAFNSMVAFVNELLSVHNNIQVYACSGNHSALGDYVLVKMLALYFRSDSRISFIITNKRFVTFKIEQNLFVVEHGYSSVSRDRLPAPGKGRETYVNNIILSKPEDLEGIKRNYYLSGDQHHTESYEMTNFEGYMFSTLVRGCRHADNSGYKSRPRQSCLTVDKQGVKEFVHFYFDQ
jgi:hypothetical protein